DHDRGAALRPAPVDAQVVAEQPRQLAVALRTLVARPHVAVDFAFGLPPGEFAVLEHSQDADDVRTIGAPLPVVRQALGSPAADEPALDLFPIAIRWMDRFHRPPRPTRFSSIRVL